MIRASLAAGLFLILIASSGSGNPLEAELTLVTFSVTDLPAAPVTVEAGAQEAALPVGPLCILGYMDVLCPYPCSNGIDDDGDGRTDYPYDPGCDTPQDYDEYDAPPPPPGCYPPEGERHSRVDTQGGPWGTVIDIFGKYYGAAPNCPWSPMFYQILYACGYVSGKWREDSCQYTETAGRRVEVRGTFSCISSSCASAPSPHSLTAILDINPPGWYCSHTFPATAYPNNVVTHCEEHPVS